ncbi:hypothetical protein DH2020_007048 [Rehmannia glutinosa]|uniref:Pectinesterase inhibitor domain-containing protein n=1 Tax=Rehmannia glutinosa TaxID=99300 RepID=A0ABR0TXC9_REHGL
MASLFSHQTLTIFIASLMAFSVLASDQYCNNLTSVKNICKTTQFPDLCYKSLVPKIGSDANPQLIYKQSAELALSEISKASLDFATNGKIEQLIQKIMPNNRLALSALESCRTFLSLASYNVNNTLSSSTGVTRDDIRTWLSAANADLETCKYGFADLAEDVRNVVVDKLKNSTEFTINSLAIITEIDKCERSKMEANKN